jgi:hypothetical protein
MVLSVDRSEGCRNSWRGNLCLTLVLECWCEWWQDRGRGVSMSESRLSTMVSLSVSDVIVWLGLSTDNGLR